MCAFYFVSQSQLFLTLTLFSPCRGHHTSHIQQNRQLVLVYTKIYLGISSDVQPDHAKTPGTNNFNENPPPCCDLLQIFVWCSSPLFTLFRLVPSLAFSLVLSVLDQLDTSSYDGLTVRPTNSDLVPSRLGLLPERILFSFLFSPVLVTWYSLGTYELPRIFLLTQSGIISGPISLSCRQIRVDCDEIRLSVDFVTVGFLGIRRHSCCD